MIDQELQNQLKEAYNSEGTELRDLQHVLIDLLVEFDRICRLSGIPYWIDDGTLLGAVRHGGFIPWDDDIDVCVRREDLGRLYKAMQENLKEPYRYYATLKTPKYRWPQHRFVNSNVAVNRLLTYVEGRKNKRIRQETLKMYVWLDIWVQCNGCLKVKNFIDSFYGVFLRRKIRYIEDGKAKRLLSVVCFPFARVFVAIARFTGKLFHHDTLINDYGVCTTYSVRKTNEVYPLVDIEFEGHMVSAPGNADAYLKRLYGDYMTIPSEKCRATHCLSDMEVKGD